jgi:lysyl endopeptidase
MFGLDIYPALLLLLCSPFARGQVQVKGSYPPRGMVKSIGSPQAHVSLPPLNNQDLLQAAKAEEIVNPGPFKFGEAIQLELDMSAGQGEWSIDNAAGRRVWRAIIKSPNALSLSILFSEFYLPPDSEFYVVGKGDEVMGAFTGKVNNKDDGKFATGPIRGDEIMLEYNEPISLPASQKRALIKVYKVVHGFRKILLDTDNSGRCNIDVKCPEGNGKVLTWHYLFP